MRSIRAAIEQLGRGDIQRGAATIEQGLRIAPDNPQAHLNLAVCNMELRNAGKVASEIRCVETLLEKPGPDVFFQIGNIYRGLGSHLYAKAYYRRALALNEKSAALWYALGDVESQAGEHKQAYEALQHARRLGYPDGPMQLAMARFHVNREEIDEARTLLSAAFASAGQDVVLINNIARQYSLIGDFDAQASCLQRVLQLDPDDREALFGLAALPGREFAKDDLANMRRLADDKAVDAATRSRIGFALGNYYRYAERYDEAFSYYRLGNRMKGYHFDRSRYLDWLERIEKIFTRSFFARRAGWGSESRMPVLIEALTQQQIAQQADAYLQEMQKLSRNGENFVINTLPHNFEQLGLFAMLFPRAPIVHIERDPRDTLLSIYFHDFTSIHEYAYDLESLGRYYRLYERLMAHWLEVMPNPVYSLKYEALVSDPEGQVHAMAEFIGVDPDDRMLQFHEQERRVDTATKWQVRQPVYTSSVARWKPYERHLKPLFDALGAIE